MGNHRNISHDRFPNQGKDLNQPATVLFHYDRTHPLAGVIIRDDMEEPYLTLIRLSDGRVVTAGECQYSPKAKGG